MYLFIKRLLDIFISATTLIITSPIFVIVFIILFFINKRQVFFIQRRPGLNEKIFKIIKFKTMNDRVTNDGKLLPDSERLTKLGKFLRKTSIDEIPQLINVLKGDMSMIGPRPLLVEYLPLYTTIQKKRHNLRPGITGWAQINGRNAISWTKKFEYDIWYVENISFAIDFRIIFMTIKKVFKSEGISSDVSVTMDKFLGG